TGPDRTRDAARAGSGRGDDGPAGAARPGPGRGAGSAGAPPLRRGPARTGAAPVTASKATAAAMSRAAVYLLGRQHPDGYWWGDFDTGASATVPDILLRRPLEIKKPAALGRSAAAIRAGQQPGGCWSLYE